jgi:single-stranded DNA-binding protein
MKEDKIMNKAILIGNLRRDPEISYTQGCIVVTKFNIATSKKWKDKITGKFQESCFIRQQTSTNVFGKITFCAK